MMPDQKTLPMRVEILEYHYVKYKLLMKVLFKEATIFFGRALHYL